MVKEPGGGVTGRGGVRVALKGDPSSAYFVMSVSLRLASLLFTVLRVDKLINHCLH